MRRRDIAALVVIWVLVFAMAFAFAALYADDDPATDEGAGAGALAAVVGAFLSGVYLFFALDVRSRRQQSQQQTAVANSTTTPAEGTVAMIKRNWRRMVLAVVLWAVAAVGLVAVGASPEIATWVAGLLPLAVLLYLHRRSS